MTININISTNVGYVSVEETTWKDWISFGVSIGATLYFILISFGMWKRSIRKYGPMRVRNIKKLTLMNFFSICHIWTTIICDDYFNWGRKIEQTNCVFWNYWAPYSLALGGWFAIFILRLFDYLALFKIELVDPDHRRKWRIIIFLILMSPPIILSFVITITNGSFLATKPILFCNSSLICQIMVTIYVLIYIIITIIFIIMIKLVIHEDSALNEYNVLKSIAWNGLLVLWLCAFIQVFDEMTTSFWRMTFLLAIIYIHLYASIRLSLKEFYFAWKQDQQFLMKFLENEGKSAQFLFPPSIILFVDEIKTDFILYLPATQKTSEKNKNIFDFIHTIKLDWKPLFNSFPFPSDWSSDECLKYKQQKSHKRYTQCLTICSTFLSNQGLKFLNIPSEFISPIMDKLQSKDYSADMFNPIENYLLNSFISQFGMNYIKTKMNRPEFMTRDIKEKLLLIQRNYLIEQMKKEKLISHKSEISFDVDLIELQDVY